MPTPTPRDELDPYSVAQAVATQFSQLKEVDAVALGGSLATGQATAQSDIDLYVFSHVSIPLEARAHIVGSAHKDRPSFRTPSELTCYKEYRDASEEGRQVQDKVEHTRIKTEQAISEAAEALLQRAWTLRHTDPGQARTLAAEAGQRVTDAHTLAYVGLVTAFCDTAECSYTCALEGALHAYNVFERVGDAPKQAHAGVLLGLVHTRLGDYERALVLHGDSLATFERLGDSEGQGLALMYNGGVYLDQGESRRALEVLQRALSLFEAHGEQAHAAQALLMLGIAYEALGDPASAHRCDLAALELARTAGDRRQEATLLNNLGTHYRDAADDVRALEHFLQALALTEVTPHPNLRVKLLGNIGEVQLGVGETAAALRSFEAALALSRQLGQRRDEGSALETLGETHAKLGQLKEARRCLGAALALRETIGDKRGQGSARVKLASVCLRERLWTEAFDNFTAALACALETENLNLQVEALLGRGRLAYEQGNLEAARERLQEALALAKEFGLERLLCETHEALAEAHESAGDAALALVHLKEHHRLERKLFGERGAQQTRRLTLGLELERARQEADFERLRATELARANMALEVKDRENARLLAELQRQAQEDALTGLPNRRSFTERLAAAFAQAIRQERPLAVALADVDDFKSINDRFSHAVGDVVLKQVAELLRGALRAGDTVARVGGEEFAFVFPDTAEAEARTVCERVRSAVSEHDWRRVHPELRVSVSVGTALDTNVSDGEKMLAQADARLYEAKRAGKNRVC